MKMVPEIITKIKDGAQALCERISNSPSIGIFYAIASTLFFSYNYVAAQEVLRLQRDFPVLEIVMMRSLIQLLLITPFILIKKKKVTFSRSKWCILFQLTLISYLIMGLGYIALMFIPSSLLLPLSATCPLFAILFSVYMLKDKFVWLDAVCSVAALIGVLFIYRPKLIFGVLGIKSNSPQQKVVFENPELNATVGCVLAILFGAMKALFLTYVKKWSFIATDFTPLLFYQSILGTIITPIIMLLRGHVFVLPRTPYVTYSLIVASGFTLFGSLSIMMATKTQSPTVVSIIRNLDVLWGFLLQFAFLRIWPSPWSIGGSVLIIITTIVICFRKKILDRISELMTTQKGYAQLNNIDDNI